MAEPTSKNWRQVCYMPTLPYPHQRTFAIFKAIKVQSKDRAMELFFKNCWSLLRTGTSSCQLFHFLVALPANGLQAGFEVKVLVYAFHTWPGSRWDQLCFPSFLFGRPPTIPPSDSAPWSWLGLTMLGEKMEMEAPGLCPPHPPPASPSTLSHLLFQLNDPGLGIAQSLVQDFNVSPVVLTRGPHCR